MSDFPKIPAVFREAFDTSLSRYIVGAGSGGSVSGGKLVSNGTNGLALAVADLQVIDSKQMIAFTLPGSVPGGAEIDLVLKASDPTLGTGSANYVEATYLASGSIVIYVNGVSRATAAVPNSAGATYYLFGKMIGNKVVATLYTVDPRTDPSAAGTSITYTLSGAEIAAIGSGVKGYCGLDLYPAASTGFSWDDHIVITDANALI